MVATSASCGFLVEWEPKMGLRGQLLGSEEREAGLAYLSYCFIAVKR